jgi:hypothetical protein
MAIYVEGIPEASWAREATKTACERNFADSISKTVKAINEGIKRGKCCTSVTIEETAAVDFIIERLKEQGYSVVYWIDHRDRNRATLDLSWELRDAK